MMSRVFAFFVAVAAVGAMTGTVLSAQLPNLPAGSKVFIAPMAGFDSYFRTATKGAEFPLVFVPTRGQAVYEVTGSTKEVPVDVEGVSGSGRTTRLDSTITVTNIESGQIVFTHSVRTAVSSPHPSSSWSADRATRTPTPPRLLAIGKENAARRCAQALRDAVNEKP